VPLLRPSLARFVGMVFLPAFLHIQVHIHLHHRFHGPPIDYVTVALAAAASFLGVPGPGESVLIGAGILAAHHKLDIGSIVVVAFLAATAGGIIGWAVGHKLGRAVVTAPGPLLRARLWAVRRGDAVFERYTVTAILLAPSWVAGINRVKAGVYNVVNVLSAAAWAAGLGLGGYFAGPPVIDAVSDLGTVAESVLAAVIVLGGAFALWRHHRHRLLRGLKRPPTDPSETS
jgi:membrane-associated protein